MLTRFQVEDFLFHEAELLDAWKLDEWSALYTDDARYEIASPGTDDPINANPDQTLFLVADGIVRIRARAVRLSKKSAHAEYPHSKTRHMITNVRVTHSDNDETRARANFAVYRTKEDTSTVYMGEAFLTLVQDGDLIKVRHKRCILDLNSLYNQGRLTIIL